MSAFTVANLAAWLFLLFGVGNLAEWIFTDPGYTLFTIPYWPPIHFPNPFLGTLSLVASPFFFWMHRISKRQNTKERGNG